MGFLAGVVLGFFPESADCARAEPHTIWIANAAAMIPILRRNRLAPPLLTFTVIYRITTRDTGEEHSRVLSVDKSKVKSEKFAMASIPVLPANSPSSEVVACLERDGCVVVRDVIDKAARDTIARELAPHLENSDAGNRLNKAYEANGGNGNFYPGNTKRITALVAKSETFRSFVTNPL